MVSRTVWCALQRSSTVGSVADVAGATADSRQSRDFVNAALCEPFERWRSARLQMRQLVTGPQKAASTVDNGGADGDNGDGRRQRNEQRDSGDDDDDARATHEQDLICTAFTHMCVMCTL